jgi:hypothetical protein
MADGEARAALAEIDAQAWQERNASIEPKSHARPAFAALLVSCLLQQRETARMLWLSALSSQPNQWGGAAAIASKAAGVMTLRIVLLPMCFPAALSGKHVFY